VAAVAAVVVASFVVSVRRVRVAATGRYFTKLISKANRIARNDGAQSRVLPSVPVVHALTGVYDADGSLRGEVAYVVGKLLGRRHCALCDITHGSLRPRPTWEACRTSVRVPFEVVHLDERTPEVRAASEGHAPCVLAHTDGGVELLLSSGDLEACAKDPARLVAAIEQRVDERGWTWLV